MGTMSWWECWYEQLHRCLLKDHESLGNAFTVFEANIQFGIILDVLKNQKEGLSSERSEILHQVESVN